MITAIVDSFSGSASDLKRGHRTKEELLKCLARDPRISDFDFSEHYKWLCPLVNGLVKDGLITEDKSTQFPWHRYELTFLGKIRLKELTNAS